MADRSVPKAMADISISKTKELKGTEKRDALIEIEKVCSVQSQQGYLTLTSVIEIPATVGRRQSIRGRRPFDRGVPLWVDQPR